MFLEWRNVLFPRKKSAVVLNSTGNSLGVYFSEDEFYISADANSLCVNDMIVPLMCVAKGMQNSIRTKRFFYVEHYFYYELQYILWSHLTFPLKGLIFLIIIFFNFIVNFNLFNWQQQSEIRTELHRTFLFKTLYRINKFWDKRFEPVQKYTEHKGEYFGNQFAVFMM